MDTESHPGTTRSNIAGSSGKAGKTTDLPTDSFSSSASPGYYLVLEDAATGQGDLPGGRINKDEIHRPFTENLAREVQEELGSLRYRLYPEPIFVFPHFVFSNAFRKLRDACQSLMKMINYLYFIIYIIIQKVQ